MTITKTPKHKIFRLNCIWRFGWFNVAMETEMASPNVMLSELGGGKGQIRWPDHQLDDTPPDDRSHASTATKWRQQQPLRYLCNHSCDDYLRDKITKPINYAEFDFVIVAFVHISTNGPAMEPSANAYKRTKRVDTRQSRYLFERTQFLAVEHSSFGWMQHKTNCESAGVLVRCDTTSILSWRWIYFQMKFHQRIAHRHHPSASSTLQWLSNWPRKITMFSFQWNLSQLTPENNVVRQ